MKNQLEANAKNTLLETLLSNKTDAGILQRMTGVLSLLSKDDALSLFILAKDGIESELDTPSKIGLTKKQYYTRLKQLVDFGLLAKNGNEYAHTVFGTLIYQKHILGLVDNIKNSKQLEMIDVLKRTSRFNTKDIADFMSKVGIPINSDFTSETNGLVRNSIITWSYDDMVTKVLEIIEFAQKEIILISRFTNELIINAMLKKTNMGVSVKVLADTNLVEGFVKDAKEKAYLDDKNKNERTDVIVNPYYPTQVDRKYIRTPFCVLIVDNKHVGIEIVDNYNPTKFKMAIFAVDTVLSNQMRNLFDDLWKKASTNPPQISTKTTRK